jgi:sRNA-binding regulator protein Hfq
LAKLISPENKRKIMVREISSPSDQFITTIDLRFEKSGVSVYTVNGVDLDIHVYWKDNYTVIIETRADYVAISQHGERYQCLDDVVKVEYVVR